MQHIAVIRPEIAAGPVETAKVRQPSQQHQGFSRHLQQHHRTDSQDVQSEQRQLAEQRHRKASAEAAEKSPSGQTHARQDQPSRAESTTDKSTKAESGAPAEHNEPSRPDAETTQAKNSRRSNAQEQPEQQTDQSQPKPVAENTGDKDEIGSNEEKQAEDWLALVHKLVTNAQATHTDSESVDTQGADETELNTLHADSEISDKHKALLEQLGLDAEKVLHQAQAAGKLVELRALLQDAVETPDKGQEALAVEQVLALLLTEQSTQADKGAPVAQNHGLGLKADGAKPASKLPDQSSLRASVMQEYQQHGDESEQQQKDLSSVLNNATDKSQQAVVTDGAALVGDKDRLKQDATGKDVVQEKGLLQQLARLPEPALDKALQNLADRLPVKDAEPAVINSFIDHLKAGIEEFKQQRAQGREPGLDLQSLVSRAIGGESEVQSAQQQSVTQVLKQFGESLAQSPATVRADSHSGFTLHATERLSGQDTQVAAETAKAAPNTVMERAVNIARPEAAGQLADRVRMMVSQGNMSADIRLDPPDLGSMQIRISINGEQASVNFVVQSQQARDMLDQAVPRLRDMLAERGIELGQSSVEQQQKDNKSGDSQQQGQLASTQTEDELSEQQGDNKQGQDIRLVNGALGGIDYFV